MATSLHFGPEWMRRGPGKSASNANASQANGNAPGSGGGGGGGGGAENTSNRSVSPGRPSSNTSATSAGAAATAVGNGPLGALGSLPTSTRRNPSLGNLSHAAPSSLSSQSGPGSTLGSPAVSSPGLFSFAAAAAGGGGAVGSGGGGGSAGGATGSAGITPGNTSNSTLAAAAGGGGASSQQPNSSSHQSGANADADYKLLSLYGADPQSNANPKSPLPDTGKEHWSTVGVAERGKKKPLGGILDRDRDLSRRNADTGGPLSPALGGEPRGLNTRAFSGSSTGVGEGRRSGLFGRGQGGGGIGVLNVNTGSSAGSGPVSGSTNPMSPSMPRERFSGIQGGVLGGVAPTRKRQDSEGGGNSATSTRMPRPPSDDAEQGHDRRPSRTRLSMGALGEVGTAATDAVSSPLETQPETPRSALPTPTGGSLSGRFKRDRIPGEGPIGPNADGSAGFGKFSSVGRKRERQSAAAAAAVSSAEPGQQDTTEHQGVAETDAAAGEPVDQNLADRTSSSLSLANSGPLDTVPDSSAKLHTENLSHAASDEPTPAESAEWSPETETWYYKDPSGTSQGPFPATTMQDWFEQSYFTGDLPMRRGAEEEFEPLASILAALGHPEKPFLTPPVAAPLAPLAPEVERSAQSGDQSQQQPLLEDSAPQHLQSAADLNVGAEHGDSGLSRDVPQSAEGLAPDVGGRPFDQYGSFGTPGQQDPSAAHPWGPNDRMGPGFGSHAWSQSSFGFGGGPGPLPPQSFGEHHSPFLQHVQPPQSPFGAPAAFGPHGPRGQEEYLHMIRQRELQEQRHAAAAAAARAQAGSGLGFAAPPHYLNDAFGARPGQAWNDVPGPWSHQGVHGLPGHQLPPFQHNSSPFGAFNPQRQPSFDSVGSPWRSAAVPSLPDGGFNHQPNDQRSASQVFDQVTNPIAPADASHEEAHPAHQQTDGASVQAAATPPDAPAASLPTQAQTEIALDLPPAASSPSAPTVANPATPTPPEPTPEELWPQSPSAVEFAAEPRLAEEPAPAQAISEADRGDGSETSVRNKRSRRKQQQQASEGALSDTGATGKAPRGAEQAGGLKVLSREEFEKAQSGQGKGADQGQASAATWLVDSPSGGTPTASKAPWAKDQAESGTAPGGLSLRQIQEAEQRQAEMRRAAERADAAQRIKTSSAASDALPTTMRWGLASGHAHGAPPSVEDARASTPTTSAAPAWNTSTSASKKKTLMQIQEEEQKRAAKAKEAQAAQQAALQRGYADSATRQTAPAPAVSQGGGWSVVGAKSAATNSPVVATAARPAGASASARAVSLNSPAAGAWVAGTAKQNGAVAAPARSSVTSSPAVSKAKTASSSAAGESGNDQPSAEFLKYLKDQLKGLNVKVEDFVEMLLSFPLDPSPDVVEIIAESVYANSSTMDGRRFAADFVAKRKMDAQSGRGVGAGVGGGGGGWSGRGGALGFGMPNGQGSMGRSTSESFGAAAGVGGGARSSAAAHVAAGATAGSSANDFAGFKVVKAKGGKKGGRA
ncbi:hypothetical protein IE81DRAFT_342905 [Ceraceosorus guamensis]|uniref:GYF domain-containing protein n=1 Tax=Ceraceosorus guamensis TaxID=1522189 RepID=A0A316VRK6_9BASI|nr:hypothetical protein IE81DRAFT_342905 [Ceraceosorus guamensis]PWN40142.1 hypothetical protein IE81DRAFT_342905 [Ceraceosorus guamensis]